MIKEKSKRSNSWEERNFMIPVLKERKIRIKAVLGRYVSKDTIVIKNNVTVSFLCLLAAPWCWGCAPHKNLTAMEE